MSYRPAMLDQKIANSDSAETSANGLTTEDWLALARETLIKEGVDAVKIDRLAKMAGVTPGGFYWRFKSRNDLLDQLLEACFSSGSRNSATNPIMISRSAAGRRFRRGSPKSSARSTRSASARCGACSATAAMTRPKRRCARASPIIIRSAIMRWA